MSLVSVVIPTYDRALRVQRAIESVLTQTHDRVEVIVVDDGSTDRTADRVSERFGTDGRLQVIRTDNRGVARARNVGIEAASGDFVAFLDSDDEWFPWKLEFQLRCLDRTEGAGMIWTDMRAVDPDGNELAPRYLRRFYHRYDEIDVADILDGPLTVSRAEFGTADLWYGDLYPAMLGGNLVHTSTVLMTRARIDVVRGFDEELVRTGEDFDFHLRTAAAGPVAFADVPTITYRVGAPDQLTRPDLMVQMARNHLATIEKAIDADRGRTPEREMRRVRAAAHGWLGEELLDSGLGTEAAPHLRTAIRGPRGIRAAVLWALTRLPERFSTIVRAGLGRITRPFRRRSAG